MDRPAFWTFFSAAVGNRSDLSNQQKFSYLVTPLLSGEDHGVIEAYSRKGENCEAANEGNEECSVMKVIWLEK